MVWATGRRRRSRGPAIAQPAVARWRASSHRAHYSTPSIASNVVSFHLPLVESRSTCLDENGRQVSDSRRCRIYRVKHITLVRRRAVRIVVDMILAGVLLYPVVMVAIDGLRPSELTSAAT